MYFHIVLKYILINVHFLTHIIENKILCKNIVSLAQIKCIWYGKEVINRNFGYFS